MPVSRLTKAPTASAPFSALTATRVWLGRQCLRVVVADTEAEREEGLIRMNGHDTFRQAVERLCDSTLTACRLAGAGLEEIDVFAYHQANARILVAVGERLELDPARVVNCIDRFGNTSAATIPLALADAIESGLLRTDSRVLLAAFGGGLTWAATVIDWGAERCDEN